MEGGDRIPPMVKIKQEAIEEEEEERRPSETEGYQIFFIAEDVIKEEEMTQDDVEEQLRRNDTKQNSLQDVDVEMPVTNTSSCQSDSMKGGDKILPVMKIKQEVIEAEEEQRPSETEGYQIFFMAEDAIKEEGMTQDDVEEQLRRNDTKQNSLHNVDVEMPVTPTSSCQSVGNTSWQNTNQDLEGLSEENIGQDKKKQQNGTRVGIPSFESSKQDSNLPPSGENIAKDDLRVGSAILQIGLGSTGRIVNPVISGHAKGNDGKSSAQPGIPVGSAVPQIRLESTSRSANPVISAHAKGNDGKSSAQPGIPAGMPVLLTDKERATSNQDISGLVQRKVFKTSIKDKDNRTSSSAGGKDYKTLAKSGTLGKILRVSSSSVLIQSSGLKLNAKLWTRANPHVDNRSCPMVYSASSHIQTQGVDSQMQEVNKEEEKVNSPSSCPKLGEMNKGRREQPNSHIALCHQPFQCRPNSSKPTSTKSDITVCRKVHTAENPTAIADHLSNRAAEKRHQCSDCGKRFLYKWERIEHIMTAHSGKTLYQCSHCYKGFEEEAALTHHVKEHLGDQPFHCPHCDKRFRRKCYLTLHLRTHSDKVPYNCPHCNKGFYRKDGLSEHIRIHTGERPFKCSYCSKDFARKRNLTTHMSSHIGQSLYKCAVCNKGFSSKCNHSRDVVLIYPSE